MQPFLSCQALKCMKSCKVFSLNPGRRWSGSEPSPGISAPFKIWSTSPTVSPHHDTTELLQRSTYLFLVVYSKTRLLSTFLAKLSVLITVFLVMSYRRSETVQSSCISIIWERWETNTALVFLVYMQLYFHHLLITPVLLSVSKSGKCEGGKSVRKVQLMSPTFWRSCLTHTGALGLDCGDGWGGGEEMEAEQNLLKSSVG